MFDETPDSTFEIYEAVDTIEYLFPRGRLSDSYPFKPLRDNRPRQETRAGGETVANPKRDKVKRVLTPLQQAVRDYDRAMEAVRSIDVEKLKQAIKSNHFNYYPWSEV